MEERVMFLFSFKKVFYGDKKPTSQLSTLYTPYSHHFTSVYPSLHEVFTQCNAMLFPVFCWTQKIKFELRTTAAENGGWYVRNTTYVLTSQNYTQSKLEVKQKRGPPMTQDI